MSYKKETKIAFLQIKKKAIDSLSAGKEEREVVNALIKDIESNPDFSDLAVNANMLGIMVDGMTRAQIGQYIYDL